MLLGVRRRSLASEAPSPTPPISISISEQMCTQGTLCPALLAPHGDMLRQDLRTRTLSLQWARAPAFGASGNASESCKNAEQCVSVRVIHKGTLPSAALCKTARSVAESWPLSPKLQSLCLLPLHVWPQLFGSEIVFILIR